VTSAGEVTWSSLDSAGAATDRLNLSTSALTSQVPHDWAAGVKATTRTNLGLGSAAVEDTSAFDAAGTGEAAATAAVGAHVAAGDPHTGYQLESEKDTASGYAGLDANARLLSTRLQLTATDLLVGRSTVGAGASEEIACTAAGRALLDDATAAAQRSTLGLGSAAVADVAASLVGGQSDVLTGTLNWTSFGTMALATADLSLGAVIRVTVYADFTQATAGNYDLQLLLAGGAIEDGAVLNETTDARVTYEAVITDFDASGGGITWAQVQSTGTDIRWSKRKAWSGVDFAAEAVTLDLQGRLSDTADALTVYAAYVDVLST